MHRERIAAGLSFLVAVGILLAGILGPLVSGVIRFHLPDSLVNQYVGGEFVTLFLAAPALLAAGLLWLRGDPLAPALACGPAAYTVYTFVTAVIGQEYARYGGNAEKAFPLYVALILGGVVIVALAATELVRGEVPPLSDGLRKLTAGVFLVIAAVFALAWTAQILQVYRGKVTTEYEDGPTLFWLIKMMDLGFLLPAFAVAGVGLLRRHPLAMRLASGMVSYAVCMAGAVLGMALAMLVKDDPAASTGMVLVLAPVTGLLAIIAFAYLRDVHDGPRYRAGRSHAVPLGSGHA